MPASNLQDFLAGSVLTADELDALQTWIRQNFIAKDTNSEPLNNNAYLKAKNASGAAYNTVGIDGSNLTQVGDAALITKLNGIPAVFAYNNANQAIPNNSYTPVALNSEDFDTTPSGTMHDTVTNNTRLVAPIAGKYLIVAVGSMTPTAAGDFEISIRLNAGTYYGASRVYVDTANKNHILTAATILNLSANDYVEMYCLQVTGVSQDLRASGPSPNFYMVRVG